MDEIDLKLEKIDEAYERVRSKLSLHSRNDLLDRAAAMLRSGEYQLEVIRDATPIYELGRASPVLHIENRSPVYRITGRNARCNHVEQIEIGEEINDIPEFQEILRRFKGG